MGGYGWGAVACCGHSSLQLTTSLYRGRPRYPVVGTRVLPQCPTPPLHPHTRCPPPPPRLRQVSISKNKTWPGSGLSYLHGGWGNMWSGLHFMKAAATHDTLSIPGDLWGCMVLMVSVGLVSSPHSSWPLSPRQMGDKPSPAGPAQQEGMAGRAAGRRGRPGAGHQACLGGAAAGKPLGAHPERPINPGDLQAAGSLPEEVSQGSRLVGRG